MEDPRDMEALDQTLFKAAKTTRPKPSARTTPSAIPSGPTDEYWIGFLAATVSHMIRAEYFGQALQIGSFNLRKFLEQYDGSDIDGKMRGDWIDSLEQGNRA